jgi:hypothetical protein
MSVAAAMAGRTPMYVPLLDSAQSLTASELGEGVTGRRYTPSNSWLEGQTALTEDAVRIAVLNARLRKLDVAEATVRLALQLLWTLPTHVPSPDVFVEDDGEIVFDWDKGPDKVVTFSLSDNGELGYAALLGSTPNYGRAPFLGSIPPDALQSLLLLYPVSTATGR